MSFRRVFSIGLVMSAVLLTAGATIASAQDALTIDTTFAFRVGTTVHQPGKYELRPNADEMGIQITPAKGAATLALVVTRLGMTEPPASDGYVIFDKVGDAYYLSEIWIPGADGYLLHSTKAKHTHVRVNLNKKG